MKKKIKFDLMSELMINVKVISGCTVLLGSIIINCSQEEAFGNLLSRLADQGGQVLGELGWSCDLYFYSLPATRVYFVIKLARATKH